MNYYFSEPREDELYHYGVKGMKWGVRKQRELVGRHYSGSDDHYREQRRQKIKRAAIIGAAVIGTAAVAYGGYKLSSIRKSNQAAVGKFIYENGFMPKKTITGKTKRKAINPFTGNTLGTETEYQYRQDSLSRSLLGPKLRSKQSTRLYMNGKRSRAYDQILDYGQDDPIRNKVILNKNDRNYYANYYKRYIKGR